MFGAKRHKSLLAGLVLTGLTAIGMPAQAVTVHPGHTEIGDDGNGDAYRGHALDGFNAHANANLFHEEAFVASGRPQAEVSNVPIPNAVWLFLSAIALLFGISFCRRTVKG